MEYMNKLYYNIRPNEKEERDKRYNFDSALRLPFTIKPMDQSEEYPLYYIPTNKTIDLILEIVSMDKVLEQEHSTLAGEARMNFLISAISEELFSTNELEGVKSSRKEIVESTRYVVKNEKSKTDKRFLNVIKSYLFLINGQLTMPENISDIRRIYDEIVQDGVELGDLPDGELFRLGMSNVIKDGVKFIHRGLYAGEDGEETELMINIQMSQLLKFMNSNNKCNDLIKIAVGHYFFGYIHPFYDGNGRTGRFISSLYLKEKNSWLTALSLSRGCKEERNLYLQMFDRTNKISMQGEMNYFVDNFLRIISVGQKSLLTTIQEKKELLDIAVKKIIENEKLNESNNSEELKKIMFILAQDYHFGTDLYGIGAEELKEDDSLPKTNKILFDRLRELEDLGFVKNTKKRPIQYRLNEMFLESK